MSDPHKRDIYDHYGEEGLNNQVPPPGSGGVPEDSTNFQFNPKNDADAFSEFFESKSQFGGMRGAPCDGYSRGGGREASSSVPRKAPPIERNLPCSLEDLYRGTTKKMKISRNVIDIYG